NTITNCNTGTYLDPNIPITVEGNWIYYTGTAIQLVNGTGEAIIDNVLFANQIGITLSNSANTTIRSNIIADSVGYGIFIANQSKTNMMTNNTFIGNNAGSTQAFDNCSSNTWYNNSWSDFRDRYPYATNNGTTWSIGYQIDGGAGVIDKGPCIYQTLNPKSELLMSLGNELSALSFFVANISTSALRSACQSYLAIATVRYNIVLDSYNGGTPFNATILHELDQQITNIANTAMISEITAKCATIHTLVQDVLYTELGPFVRALDNINWSLNDIRLLVGQLPNECRKNISLRVLDATQLLLDHIINKYNANGGISLSSLEILERSIGIITRIAENNQVSAACTITKGYIDQLENLTISKADGIIATLSSSINKLESDINQSLAGRVKSKCLAFAEKLESKSHDMGKDLAHYQGVDSRDLEDLSATVIKIERCTDVSIILADCTAIRASIEQLSSSV
ncbi:MAG TPA: right-handed parallel beta-helix repeat-containing protein, partial [Candidatus Lokiarchaeia archaeon]|nr:right-handed parallel beta-helix repeat-containing protein [Candidatus Lokiarchaeia archaeon]